MIDMTNKTRSKVLRYLYRKGIKVEIPLPELDCSVAKQPREIGERIIQVYALIGLTMPEVNRNKLQSWLDDVGFFDSLESKEKELFTRGKNKLTKNELMDLSWMIESILVLCWSVNVVSKMPFPDRQFTSSSLLKKMPPEISVNTFMDGLVLKSHNEILYETDLYYCLHWVVRSYDSSNAPWKVKLDQEVIMARRRSLEWMCGSISWWDITLDT
jgi:hypothetical protein